MKELRGGRYNQSPVPADQYVTTTSTWVSEEFAYGSNVNLGAIIIPAGKRIRVGDEAFFLGPDGVGGVAVVEAQDTREPIAPRAAGFPELDLP